MERQFEEETEDMKNWLTLSTGSSSQQPQELEPDQSSSASSPSPPPPPPQARARRGRPRARAQAQARPRRPRGVRARREGWTETIEPPYPWATSRRAVIHKLRDLIEGGIIVIKGEVECKQCRGEYTIEYDLAQKFSEVGGFVAANRREMQQRASQEWMNTEGLNCRLCGCRKCVMPQIKKKRSTNWLFLLLGQMIGHCKLTHLKYFCKHVKIHRTGAKDRLVYLTYLNLCQQLDPDCRDFDP